MLDRCERCGANLALAGWVHRCVTKVPEPEVRCRQGPRSGDLVVRPDKPAAIAATMPHRCALGEKTVDQLAESELGRLAAASSSSRC